MRRKTTLLFLAVCFSVALSGFARADTYYVYTQWGDRNWHDANKTWTGDSNLCWAAAASNILDWAGWGTTAYTTETSIFTYFKGHWTDKGSLPEYGWNWWVDGTLPPGGPGWSRVSTSGGNFWPGVDFSSVYHESWAGNLLADVAAFFQSGYGVTLAIYKPKIGVGYYGHALTIWGYDYTGAHGIQYNGVWVTDSDDGYTGLKYYGVSWDGMTGVWNLQGGYAGWFIGGVEALGQNPVPLPPTLLLFGSGLLGLVCWRRYRKEQPRASL